MGKSYLRTLTLEESEEWDSIVRSFKLYDTYYLSGYAKSFHIHGDGEPLLFYYNDNIVKGISVSMKRNIMEDPHFKGTSNDGEHFDLATPYGYGGWVIEHLTDDAKGSVDQLFQDYETWCLKNNIVSEFVRFHPMIGNYSSSEGFFDVIPFGEVVAIDLASPDIIWRNITSKNRNVIRKAVKNNVKIYHGRHPSIYKKFRTIYDLTMDKDDADEYYYFGDSFYSSICEDLPENAQVFWAEKDEVIIAASIMLECNGFMNYHLSGSLKEYNYLAPTNLLLYKAALWGCEHGFKSLYLGGGVGSVEDSLFKFKRSFFKGNLRRFHVGHKIFDLDAYQELTKLRFDGIKDCDFFPAYRG